MIHAITTNAIASATRYNVVPEKAETSRAERNWPANMAMVQKLMWMPLFCGVLLLTTRLLNSGVEKPNPTPVKRAPSHRSTGEAPDSRYMVKAVP